jgi:hydrogenase nickel incorporation protein HypA/HybF
MALTESIVEIAVEAAKKQGANKVTRVFVDIGALSHVELEALQFCFAAVAAGTLVEGAGLEIARVPGAGWCVDCGKVVPLSDRFAPCPECGRHGVQMTTGDELRVREMEIG